MRKKEKKTTDIELGNMYELNKKMVEETCKPFTNLELNRMQESIEGWFENNPGMRYAMLLCNDYRDYTVFRLTNSSTSSYTAGKEVRLCCEERGEILSAEPTKDGNAYEIWIRIDGKLYCYYLFDYSNAVILCD